MSASGSAGPGFDPRRGRDIHFLIARFVHHMPGLNSSMYVEKAYSTVDSDSSVGWGH